MVVAMTCDITYCKRINFRAVHIFAQFRRAMGARKYGASENIDHVQQIKQESDACKI